MRDLDPEPGAIGAGREDEQSPGGAPWRARARGLAGPLLRLAMGGQNVRSGRLRTNAILSVVFRLVSMCIGIVLVPLTLNYLNPQKYGIWLTLTSIVAWFNLFDVGLGNGLRNRLAEALAKDDRDLARTYVATAYATLSLIAGVLCVAFFAVAPFLNWAWMLNVDQVPAGELTVLVLVVFFAFSIRFVSSLINVVLSADQRTWYVGGFEMLGNLATLVGVLLVTRTTAGSLIALGGTLSLISALVPVAVSIVLFSGRYDWLRPRMIYIQIQRFRELTSLGVKFFFLQIVGVLQFGVQNVLISRLIGPESVAAYNVAFKYFSLILMFYDTAMTPLWPAFTEAFVKGDMGWIRSTVRNVLKIWYAVAAFCGVMVVASPVIYRMWVGRALSVDFVLSLVVAVYVLLNTWGMVFTMFVNSIGKIKLQILTASVAALLNVPLAILLVKSFGMGSTGIILATVLCMLPAAVLTPWQYVKIVNGRASGIWNA